MGTVAQIFVFSPCVAQTITYFRTNNYSELMSALDHNSVFYLNQTMN